MLVGFDVRVAIVDETTIKLRSDRFSTFSLFVLCGREEGGAESQHTERKRHFAN